MEYKLDMQEANCIKHNLDAECKVEQPYVLVIRHPIHLFKACIDGSLFQHVWDLREAP
jgi:hypothetical protein